MMSKIRVFVLGLLLGTCAAQAQPQPDLNTLARQMAERLQLSRATARALQETFNRHANRYEQGGFFWYVAAELQRRLNDEQRAEFWRSPQRAERDHPIRREHPTRRMPRERRPRPDDRNRRPPAPRAVRAAMRDVRLADYLNLTEAQRDSLAVLRRRERDALRALHHQRREGTLSEAAFREQVQQLRAQYRARFRQLLTSEQQQRLERWEARPEVNRQAMLEVLRLTSEQQQQLAALALQPGPERREALARILTPEQQEIVRLHHRLVHAWQVVRRKD